MLETPENASAIAEINHNIMCIRHIIYVVKERKVNFGNLLLLWIHYRSFN